MSGERNVGQSGQGAPLEFSPGLREVQAAGGREKGSECPGWDVTGARQERRLRAAHTVSEKAGLGRLEGVCTEAGDL